MINQKHQGLSEDHEPIIALCTPRGSGAIAVVRLAGVGVVTIADAFARLSSQKKLKDVSSHTIHHGHVVGRDNGAIVDEVLFLVMLAPKTFTGQDTVEISCHNNQFIIEQIINLACYFGARLACSGEFAKRAFLNNKIDLVQAEAINEVIHAQSEVALRCSMEQLHGSFSYHIKSIETTLVELLSKAEASFEFLEEEQRDLRLNVAFKQECVALLHRLTQLKQDFSLQQHLRQGVRVALVGVVNAGKSTLFNVLVKKDRAIVTPIAGTTRDSIELSVYRNGTFVTFVDTAGLRSTDDEIERQGIERSFAEAAAADVVLLVFDASQPLDETTAMVYQKLLETVGHKCLIVVNKSDQRSSSFTTTMGGNILKDDLWISAKNNEKIQDLELLLDKKIQELFSQLKSPFLLNQRQFRLVEEIELKLDSIVKSFSNVLHYELIAYHLKEVLEKVAELTGRNITERVLDKVFNDFCVGK